MSLTKKGTITDYYSDGVVIQPGFSLTEKNDGTIEGQVVFECDETRFNNLPQMNAAHPRDTRCELYNREITYLPLRKIRMTGTYFGLVSSKTTPTISYTPNLNQDPVTSHPDFATFAGTEAAPMNGAKFDRESGEFLGFFDPSVKDLFGAEFYLVPATLLSLTYWTKTVPSLGRRMTRKTSIPGFRKPSDCKEFLVIDFPYRQIGNFYQVTEQIMGSGPNGFSTILYP
jgi:hypothetical protein